MELKISDLPPQFENIAVELGIDKIKALFKEFGGTSVYFPTEKMIYKDARDREIISQYNGFNHKELAAKYNMSESYIRAIINRHKKVLKTKKLHTWLILGCVAFYILLFNSLIFEFKELIPILKLSSFPSIRTSKYIVTIAGKPKLATNCIKSSSNDIFLQIIF